MGAQGSKHHRRREGIYTDQPPYSTSYAPASSSYPYGGGGGAMSSRLPTGGRPYQSGAAYVPEYSREQMEPQYTTASSYGRGGGYSGYSGGGYGYDYQQPQQRYQPSSFRREQVYESNLPRQSLQPASYGGIQQQQATGGGYYGGRPFAEGFQESYEYYSPTSYASRGPSRYTTTAGGGSGQATIAPASSPYVASYPFTRSAGGYGGGAYEQQQLSPMQQQQPQSTAMLPEYGGRPGAATTASTAAVKQPSMLRGRLDQMAGSVESGLGKVTGSERIMGRGEGRKLAGQEQVQAATVASSSLSTQPASYGPAATSGGGSERVLAEQPPSSGWTAGEQVATPTTTIRSAGGSTWPEAEQPSSSVLLQQQ